MYVYTSNVCMYCIYIIVYTHLMYICWVLPRGLWRQGALRLHAGALRLNKRCTNLLWLYVLLSSFLYNSLVARCHDGRDGDINRPRVSIR